MRDISYENRELAEARRTETAVDKAPLADRKEAQTEFLESMRSRPDWVAEQVGWMLEGNYGYGPMLIARNVTKRMNRPALWTQLVAVYNWQCPRAMAIAAWKKLSKREQAVLQEHLEQVADEYDQAVANQE